MLLNPECARLSDRFRSLTEVEDYVDALERKNAALVTLYEADDPEPMWWHGKEVYDAWRERQEIKKAIEEMIGR